MRGEYPEVQMRSRGVARGARIADDSPSPHTLPLPDPDDGKMGVKGGEAVVVFKEYPLAVGVTASLKVSIAGRGNGAALRREYRSAGACSEVHRIMTLVVVYLRILGRERGIAEILRYADGIFKYALVGGTALHIVARKWPRKDAGVGRGYIPRPDGEP